MMNTTAHKRGAYLYYKGVLHQCSSNRDDGTAHFRCCLYLPGGAVAANDTASWCSFPTAKANTLEGKPYRCPGRLLLHRETNEGSICDAHECTLAPSGLSAVETSTLTRASMMNSSTGMTHKKGSWLNHEGVPYQCTSTTKDGYARYSCTRYLPGGVSVSSHDAKWGNKNTMRNKSPNGVQPYHCPGKMLVNLETNIKTITVAHECGLALPRATETAATNKYSVPAPAIETTNLCVVATSIDKTPKNGSYLHHEGVTYRCTFASDGCAEYRCYRFLPAGTTATSHGAKWTGYKQAKKKKPSGVPYRCPGILTIDHEKDQTFISVAHECNHSIVTEPSAAGEDARIAFPSSLMNQAVPTTKQRATINNHQEEELSVGASIGESFTCTSSQADVPPMNSESNCEFDNHCEDSVVIVNNYCGNDDGNYNVDVDEDDDEDDDELRQNQGSRNHRFPPSTVRNEFSGLALESMHGNDNQMQGRYYPRHRDSTLNPQDQYNHFRQYNSGARSACSWCSRDYSTMNPQDRDCRWSSHDYSTLIPYGQYINQYLSHDGMAVEANYWWPHDYSAMTPTDQYNQYLQYHGRERGLSSSIPGEVGRDLTFHQAPVDKLAPSKVAGMERLWAYPPVTTTFSADNNDTLHHENAR
jgi:hypothetical protein